MQDHIRDAMIDKYEAEIERLTEDVESRGRSIAALENDNDRLRARIKIADKEAAAETSFLRGEIERLRAAYKMLAGEIYAARGSLSDGVDHLAVCEELLAAVRKAEQ